MKILGNIIWVLFGGFFIALEYFVSSIGLFITIIGIPFGLQTLKLGILALWPFGSRVVDIPQSSGCLSLLMNVIWFFIGEYGYAYPISFSGYSSASPSSVSRSDCNTSNWLAWPSPPSVTTSYRKTGPIPKARSSDKKL